jgi:uncharacterized protein YbjT (DUF2867 family)
MASSPLKILVTGGTGHVGSEVVKELLKRQVAVRLLMRKEGAPTPKGVEIAIGDLIDPPSVRKALHGVDKLYLLNAVVADELTQGLIAYELARNAPVQQVVYHSAFGCDRFRDVPHFVAKLALENVIRSGPVPYTVIRPNSFFQNDVPLKDALTKDGMYPTPIGPVGISGVDIHDIAEAAAIALTTDGHHGKTYNLNGPQVLSGPARAAIWAGFLGREIRYAGSDLEAFEDQMRRQLPSWMAFDFRMMYQAMIGGGFVAEPGDIETLTHLLGHAPRRYEDFARETALTWSVAGKAKAATAP